MHNAIYPEWPAPPNVRAFTTTRADGNLALLANRESMKDNFNLPMEPVWLEQVHSAKCVVVEQDINRTADAMVTRNANTPLAIMTADCLPILLCSLQTVEVAAIHSGWRGLLAGVIENTLECLDTPANQLLAWIGPGICATCFEVGTEVRELFVQRYSFTASCFIQKGTKWLADLTKMVQMVLQASGVANIFSTKCCTFEDQDKFFSYRREQQTGRMATLIWFSEEQA